MENKKRKSLKELRESLSQSTEAMSVVENLFDTGTFAQLGAYAKRVSTLADNSEKGTDFEGVITGYGAVDGRLVFAFVQDNSRMKGAFSDAQAKKICALYDMAIKAGAPVIGVFDSNGAKIQEGVAAMAAYAKVMKKSADASGYIPQIALIYGVCAGSCAALASMSDFVIAHKESKFFVTSPFITNKSDKNSGSIAVATQAGLCDFLCEDKSALAAKVKELICFLPQNSESEAIVENDDDLNRLTPEVELLLGKSKISEIITSIADNGKALNIAEDYAPELSCSFISIGGYSCGAVANNSEIKGGAITPAAADKAAGFINLCSSFGLPVVTFVDSVGTEPTAENENSAYASALASLAYSYSQAEIPLVTAIVGKAYGVAGTVFGSKSIGADIVYATENAEISPMSPEAAVTFLYNNEIAESSDPIAAKNEKITFWTEEYASPVEAARLGEIDDIIDPAELRQRICAAIEMMKAEG